MAHRYATGIYICCALAQLMHIESSGQDGSLDQTFNTFDIGYWIGDGPDNPVHAVALQPDGKILIGGKFDRYNGTLRAHIARLNPDGRLDPDFDPGAGATATSNYYPYVYALAVQADGKILIGGEFNMYAGVPRHGIARLNADGSLDTTFDPGSGLGGGSPYVNSINVQPDGKIIIGGSFPSYNGTSRTNIARLNADGTMDASLAGPGANSNVRTTVLLPDGKILIGGGFTLYNGTVRNRIALLHADGTLDTSFDPAGGADQSVESIDIQIDGTILIGGKFTGYGGTPRSAIARLLPDGDLDESFDPGSGIAFEGYKAVNSVRVRLDGQIIIGGAFTSYNGTPVDHLALLNPDGSLDAGFDAGPGPDPEVYTTALQADGKVLAGGLFASLNGSIRLARLNADGSWDEGFNTGSGVNGTFCSVESITAQGDGKIIVGGHYVAFNGIARNNIARLNADGSLDTGFDTGTGTNAYMFATAALPDGRVMVGGSFTEYNGAACPGFARLNPDGSLDQSFDAGAGANSAIKTIIPLSGGGFLVSGGFTSYDGTPRSRIAKVLPNGALDAGFDPGIGANNGITSVIRQPDDKILMGGTFTEYNGTPRIYIARSNADGSLDTDFALTGPVNGSGILSMALQSDGKIIIGGSFTSINGIALGHIARLDPDGSLDMSFNPGTGCDNVVHSISLQADGRMVIGGNFDAFDGVPRNGFALLHTDGSLDAGFDPGTGANNAVLCTTLQDDGAILIGGRFTAYDGTGRNRIARIQNDLSTVIPMIDPAELALFPNPTEGIFFIGPGTPELLQVTVTDLLGRVVLNAPMNAPKGSTFAVDMSAQAAGIYTVTARSVTGVRTARLVRHGAWR